MSGYTAAVVAVAGVVSAAQQSSAAKSQASAVRAESERQGALQRQEAELSARQEARSNIKLGKRQKLAFLKSGVALEGSPLLLLAETQDEGDDNVEAILTSGQTRSQSTLNQGVFQATSLKSSGRQALIGGLTSAAGTAAGGFGDGGDIRSGSTFNPKTSAPPRKPLRSKKAP